MTREQLKKEALDVKNHCGDNLVVLVDDRSSGKNKPRYIGVKDLIARQDAYIDKLQADHDRQGVENMELTGTISFVRRWVQRVFDKETTLEEFYSVLSHDDPLRPIIEPPNIIDDTGYFDNKDK